jgi:hypothetical protein
MFEHKFTNPPAIVCEVSASLGQLVAEIQAAHALAERTTQQGLEHYRRVGELLRKAKDRCGHGKFLPWLKANFPFSRQHAARYMRLAENWEKCNLRLHLTDALEMLAKEKEMPAHPLTSLFPEMDVPMFQRLKQSIEHVGLLEPILTHDGMILDGRARYRACRELDIEPEFTECGQGRDLTEEDIATIIMAVNFLREPLKPDEMAALLADMKEREAVEV